MSEHRFEPEVVELLADIARDPQASLLRVPERRLLEWSGQEERISPHGSHLTKAEKHLVSAYREEAAWVLLQACILRLKQDPLIYSTVDTEPRVVRLRADRFPSLPDSETLRAVATGKEVGCSTLAASALRLAPSELGLNCLAVSHQCEGHVAASFRVLDRLLHEVSSTSQRAQALENRARGHTMKMEYQRATECCALASKTDERKIRFLVWSLTNAIQAGDDRAVVEAARQLEAHPNHRDMSAIAEDLCAARARGQWNPTPESQAVLRHHVDSSSRGIGAICHAFT